MLNTFRARNICEQEAKVVLARIIFTERTFAEFCHIFGQYVRKTARLRDKGDEIAKILQNFAENERINKSLSIGLEQFAQSLVLLNSYGDLRIQTLNDRVLKGFADYEEICKRVKDDVKGIYSAREKEIERKRQLDRVKERMPKSRQQIMQAETALAKATSEVTKSIQNLEEKTQNFEKQKLHDTKSILLDFITTEIGYHARALEVLTNSYNYINAIDEESDLEEFRKTIGKLGAELKKSLRLTSKHHQSMKHYGSLGAVGGSNTTLNKHEGIPKVTKARSEETLDSIKHSLTESDDDDDDTDNSSTLNSDNATQSEDKSSPILVRKQQ